MPRVFLTNAIQIERRRERRMRREALVFRPTEEIHRRTGKLFRSIRITNIDQLGEPPRPDWRLQPDNQFWKSFEIDNRRCPKFPALGKPRHDRFREVAGSQLRFFRIDRSDPIGERILRRDLIAETSVIEMTMRVD